LQYSSAALVWTAKCALRFHTGRNSLEVRGFYRLTER
jgi:hypothetical protein